MFSTYMKLEDDNVIFDENDNEAPVPLPFSEYDEFAERIRKTLYYGNLPSDERPSLPMSELAVGFFRDAAPKELGKVDLYWASDVGSKAFISPCSMMLSMIYIERLKHKNPEYLLTTSSSDLFLISMMVASKYLYDEGVEEEVYNEEWAESAGMETPDVNQLERDFLHAIDWSLFAEKEDFERVLTSMEQRIAMSQGLDRGSWSYSDVLVLLSSANLQEKLRHALEETLKVALVCSVAYTAGGGTVLASVATLNALREHATPMAGHYYPISEEALILPNEAVLQIGRSEAVDEDSHNTTGPKTWHATDMRINIQMNTVPQKAESQDKVYSHVKDEEPVQNHSGSLMDSAVDHRVAMHSGWSFPSFLTLALIKDTVSHIFSGEGLERTKSGESGRGKFWNKGGDTGVESGKKVNCNCPKCPLLSSRGASRRRKWVRGSDDQTQSNFLNCVFVPPYSLWGSLSRQKICCGSNMSSQGNSNRVLRALGQEDGDSEMADVSELDDSGNGNSWWKVVLSPKRESESDMHHGNLNTGEQCAVKVKRGWDEDKVSLPCWVQSHFVELTSRWETSPQFAITR